MAKDEAFREFLTGLEEALPLLQQTQDVLEDLTGTGDPDSRRWSKVWRGQGQVSVYSLCPAHCPDCHCSQVRQDSC